jgi:hypothetical protein
MEMVPPHPSRNPDPKFRHTKAASFVASSPMCKMHKWPGKPLQKETGSKKTLEFPNELRRHVNG